LPYTGQRLDEFTGGLMYYGARYYLPSLRQFPSADTIVPGAGNPQNPNPAPHKLTSTMTPTFPSSHNRFIPQITISPQRAWE
jgi:hypothetical protein